MLGSSFGSWRDSEMPPPTPLAFDSKRPGGTAKGGAGENFRAPVPETCNPYNILGPQGTKEVTPTVFSAAGGGKVQPLLHFRACVLFGGESFEKKSWFASPSPHRAPGRPTDGANHIGSGKSVRLH